LPNTITVADICKVTKSMANALTAERKLVTPHNATFNKVTW